MTSVKEALESGAISCAFQPIVAIASGRVLGYEALARCRLEEYRSPPVLFQAAIADGLCGQLGRALRQMAVVDCPDYPLFLNMHPDELGEGWLVRPDDPLSSHDQDVYLEITESVPLSHYQYCHSVLREIRGRGVRIAVDDLGAGYSNLKYIADLQPEVVKLDRELIAGLRPDTALFTLVSSIVELCHAQGAQVVAEGIETATEMRSVMDTGADLAQGYYLARPAATPPPVDWQRITREVRAPTLADQSGRPPA
jgi:EAL domain-containing protein (putative c-di-GMP-specific phosphodiesterase class I)